MLKIAGLIASRNSKDAQQLNSLRMKDGTVIATNMNQTIHASNLIPQLSKVDALVDAEAFLKVWDVFQEPKATQKTKTLEIEGKGQKTKMQLLDVRHFPSVYEQLPQGLTIDPSDLKGALMRLLPFLKMCSASDPFVMVDCEKKYLYVIDGNFVVRTTTMADLPTYPKNDKDLSEDEKIYNRKLSSIITLNRSFVEHLEEIDEKPTSVIINDKSITFVFGDSWIQNTRVLDQSLYEAPDAFLTFDSEEFQEIPLEKVKQISELTNFANKGDKIQCSALGLTVVIQGKMSWTVDYDGIPDMHLDAKMFNKILKNAHSFNFDNPSAIKFKSIGGGVEGVWSSIPTIQAAEVKEEALAAV